MTHTTINIADAQKTALDANHNPACSIQPAYTATEAQPKARVPKRRRAVLTLKPMERRCLKNGILENTFSGTLEVEGFAASDVDSQRLGTLAYALNVGAIELRLPALKNQPAVTYSHRTVTSPDTMRAWSVARSQAARSRILDEDQFVRVFKSCLRQHYGESSWLYAYSRNNAVEEALGAIPQRLRGACLYPLVDNQGNKRRVPRKRTSDRA